LILDRWPEWQPQPAVKPTLVKKLAGFSNANYLVSDGARRYVVRVNRNATHLGVDRSVEHLILNDIAGTSFSPRIVFVGEDALVTAHIDGIHPVTVDPGAMGRLFSAIHSTPTSVTRRLDPDVHLATYFDNLPAPVDPHLISALHAVRSAPPVETGEPCLCHNDLLMENVLDTGNALVVIDWEYACLGEPAFDIAALAETYNLDETQTTALLSAYGHPGLAPRLAHFRNIFALINVLWWLQNGRDIEDFSEVLDKLCATGTPGSSQLQ